MTEAQQSDPNSETLAQLDQMHAEEPAPAEPSEPSVDSEEPAPEGTFEADGQTFASESEAFKYMQDKYSQSETERLILEARQEGMQEALGNMPGNNPQPIEATPQEPDLDIDKFYEDPKGFLKTYGDQIRESVKSEVMSASATEREESKAWNEFFSAHPDLEGFQQDCQMMLDANLPTIQTLARKDKKKAQDYLAMKTREKFQNYIEQTKPTKTLSNHGGGPSGGGAPVTHNVTQKSQEKSDEALDFASQLRSIRR